MVNANVALRAEPRVFDDPRWPPELRNPKPVDQTLEIDHATPLEEGYSRAEEMLKPNPYPKDGPELPKLHALEESAWHLGQKFYRPPINVNFTIEGPNHVGVEQHKCANCGDCVTGCNYAAKNTLIMNYPPDAVNHGAEIFTEVSVRRLERKDNKWVVQCELLGVGREKFKAPNVAVSADVVANMKSFIHLARLANTGHLVDFDGKNVYLPHLDRLAIPIAFIHGAENECFLPESTEITVHDLAAANGGSLYKRQVIPGYGHIDCIFGKNAVNDVYPFIVEHLEATQ